MMTYRAPLALISLDAFKGALDGTFHELFGAPSAPFIPLAPSSVQFSYTVLSGLGALSDLDVLSGIGTLSSPAPSVALASSAARVHALIGSVSSLASWTVLRPRIVRGSTSLDGTKHLGRPARCSTYDTVHDIFRDTLRTLGALNGTVLLGCPRQPQHPQQSWCPHHSSNGVIARPSKSWRPQRPRRPLNVSCLAPSPIFSGHNYSAPSTVQLPYNTISGPLDLSDRCASYVVCGTAML